MPSIPEHLKFTYEDYLLLPEDRRYEIIGGDLFITPSPKRVHQRISLNLATILWSFAQPTAWEKSTKRRSMCFSAATMWCSRMCSS
ncbi:MAG: Uma2 family endonuclease [Bacillota bacterium]|nr:Uma2 family endonuclease [Bacillota bacterium]